MTQIKNKPKLNKFTFGKTNKAIALANKVNEVDSCKLLYSKVAKVFCEANVLFKDLEFNYHRAPLMRMVYERFLNRIEISSWPEEIKMSAKAVLKERFRNFNCCHYS